jgi:hypothetical protein
MAPCEASFVARRVVGLGAGRRGRRPYTPAMRRWVCVIALLFGFAGDGYAWSARPSLAVPIERQITGRDGRRSSTTGDWWRAA